MLKSKSLTGSVLVELRELGWADDGRACFPLADSGFRNRDASGRMLYVSRRRSKLETE